MASNTEHHKSFFDQSFSLERLGYYILSLQIGEHRISYSLFEPYRNKYIAFETFGFSIENKSDKPQSPTDFLKSKIDWIDKPFKEVNIIIEDDINTLVPQPLFDQNEAGEYLKFNHHIDENRPVRFDLMKSTGAVNVYSFPEAYPLAFKKMWPMARVIHFSTVLIESLGNNFKNKTDNNTLFLNLRGASFDLVYFKDGKLDFCNQFQFKTKEDFIYFLLAAIEQLKLNPETVQLVLMGEIDKASENYEIAFKYIRHMKLIEKNETLTYPSVFSELSLHHFYILFNVVQCG